MGLNLFPRLRAGISWLIESSRFRIACPEVSSRARVSFDANIHGSSSVPPGSYTAPGYGRVSRVARLQRARCQQLLTFADIVVSRLEEAQREHANRVQASAAYSQERFLKVKRGIVFAQHLAEEAGFERCRAQWRDLFTTEQQAQTRASVTCFKSASSWTARAMEKFVPEFTLRHWPVPTHALGRPCRGALQLLPLSGLDSLLLEESGLKFTNTQLPVELSTVHCTDSKRSHVRGCGARLSDSPHFSGSSSASRMERCAARTLLQRIDARLEVFGITQALCTGHRANSSTRLRTLEGKEALSRVVVDEVLATICQGSGLCLSVEVKMSRPPPSTPTPSHLGGIADYVIYGPDGDEVALVEVKRAYADSGPWHVELAKAVAQCVARLVGLGSARGRGRPLLGLVTDGRRWLVLELNNAELILRRWPAIPDYRQEALLLDLAAGEVVAATFLHHVSGRLHSLAALGQKM